jgi:molecular chaperone GrpE (heat shock protein)
MKDREGNVSHSPEPDASNEVSAIDTPPAHMDGEQRVGDRPPAGDAPAARTDAPCDVMATDLGVIQSRLELLNSLVAETLRLGQDRERILDQLYRENQSLRAGELEKAMAPVLRDLILLRDDLACTAARLQKDPAARTEPLAHELDGFREGVCDILYRQACELYAPAVGERFDPREHRPSSVRSTSQPDSDACIAEVLKPGFRHHGRILRPAHVIVHRFTPELTTDSAVAPSPQPLDAPPVRQHQEL